MIEEAIRTVVDMFMTGDAEGACNGQFTGTRERLAEALLNLRKLKKSG